MSEDNQVSVDTRTGDFISRVK
ncbi:MAG: hypothetical protein ACYTEG_14945 [Planctomycetota bacterium]